MYRCVYSEVGNHNAHALQIRCMCKSKCRWELASFGSDILFEAERRTRVTNSLT